MTNQTKLPLTLGAAAIVAMIAGCADPFQTKAEEQLQKALSNADESQLGSIPRREVTLEAPPSDLDEVFTPDRMVELNEMAGPGAHSLTRNTTPHGCL